MKTAIKPPEIKIYGLVRDKFGNPKVDGNPDDLPDQIKAMLTEDDWSYLKGIRNGSP